MSPSTALQVALKYLMIKSIVESQHIFSKENNVFSNVSIPTISDFYNKSLSELRNFTITQVYWYGHLAIGLKLSDGQTCKAGDRDFTNSHTFDPAKKITKIEVIIHMWEVCILQVNFYHHQQRLVKMGCDQDVEDYGGRREVF